MHQECQRRGSEFRQRQAEVSVQHTEVTCALHKQTEELHQVHSSFIYTYSKDTVQLVRVTGNGRFSGSNLAGTPTICSRLHVTLAWRVAAEGRWLCLCI